MMRKPILPYFFQNIKQKLKSNSTVRFLLFQEESPKHRVMENLNILYLAFLGLACFLAGSLGFTIWGHYTIIGFLLYYVGLLLALLETLHYMFDR